MGRRLWREQKVKCGMTGGAGRSVQSDMGFSAGVDFPGVQRSPSEAYAGPFLILACQA
jgi:hypothetical protein